MLKCTSGSLVQVTLCAADRHRVMEMRRSTDFQIQEALCLASVDIFWSLCCYEDNHWTGQWPGRSLLWAGGDSLQEVLGTTKGQERSVLLSCEDCYILLYFLTEWAGKLNVLPQRWLLYNDLSLQVWIFSCYRGCKQSTLSNGKMTLFMSSLWFTIVIVHSMYYNINCISTMFFVFWIQTHHHS